MRPSIVLLTLLGMILPGCRVEHGLEPSWSGIEGTVHFEGEWLEDLEEVRVVVYRSYPPTDVTYFLKFEGFSEELPLEVASSPYRIQLTAGVYAWVVVAGRKANQSWFDGYRFMGQFVASPGDSTPAPVIVETHEPASSVDITVDFADLPDPPPVDKQRGRGLF